MQDTSVWESVPSSRKSIASKRKICGIGVNDLPYNASVVVDNKRIVHPGYKQWKGMIERCYSVGASIDKPWYSNATVCDEWHRLSAFIYWWKVNQVEGWQIDKDIIIHENKEYSPSACIFIPKWLNVFLVGKEAMRGDCLIGVTRRRYGYESCCHNPHSHVQEYLGTFRSEIDAHMKWKNTKLNHAESLKPQMDAIDLRIYPRVVTIINSKR